MVSVSGSSRRGRRGKLTAVLDHRLRIGDESVSDNIVQAYKERGLTPPEHVETPPDIEEKYFVYWEAYQDLQSERIHSRGTIPISAILAYSAAYNLDPDTLKRIIWRVDRVLLEFWKSKEEADKRRAELERDKKQQLGGRPQ